MNSRQELRDRYYLDLQFFMKIHTVDGSGYQSFFESLMEERFENFEKVRPYGSMGDGGNDGFRRGEGIYYQVYAPSDPETKDASAAKKFGADFEKILAKWLPIESIKEYVFVFNDRDRGTSMILERRRKELADKHPNVKFTLLFSKGVRKYFDELENRSLLKLGFQIDSLEVSELARSILNIATSAIDNSNGTKALDLLSKMSVAVDALSNTELQSEFHLARSRCFRNLEKPDAALDILRKLDTSGQLSLDVYIALAETYYQLDNKDESERYLDLARSEERSSHDINIQALLRKINSKSEIPQSELEETPIADSPLKAATFYRLAGIASYSRNNIVAAERWFSKSIECNPNRFDTHCWLLDIEIFKYQTIDHTLNERRDEVSSFYAKIDVLVERFNGFDALDPRQKVRVAKMRMALAMLSADRKKGAECIESIVENGIKCHFDMGIDMYLTECLFYGRLAQVELDRITDYLYCSSATISMALSKGLLIQFLENSTLEELGKPFFRKIGQNEALDLIDALENENMSLVLPYLEGDQAFAMGLVDSMKEYSKFAEAIIDVIDSSDFLKHRVKLQLLCRTGLLDEALKLSKEIDLQVLTAKEIYDLLSAVSGFDAWDIEINLIQRLIQLEPEANSVGMKLKLFDALTRAKRYPEVISIGTELVGCSLAQLAGYANWELTLRNTLVACVERSVLDESFLEIALDLATNQEREVGDFTINARIIPDIYIRLGRFREAFDATIRGVEKSGQIPNTEYGPLFFNLTTRLGDDFSIQEYEIEVLREGDFFLVEGSDKWYRLSNESILGSLSISQATEKYSQLLGSKVGAEVDFSSRYSKVRNPKKIRAISSLSKFVFDHVVSTANELAGQDMLPGATAFSIPEINGEIDAGGLFEILTDLTGDTSEFLELYSNSPIPFAALSMVEGGYVRAISKIISERKGYINFSSGNPQELGEQIELAKSTLSEDAEFYLDATAAVFLTESGLMLQLLAKSKNLKIPNSVLDLLCAILKNLVEHSSSEGSLSLAGGRILFREANESGTNAIGDTIRKTIQSIENDTRRIALISGSYKSEEISEKNFDACYVDASVLARRSNSPILTDDYNYLKMSELQHGYIVHKYFSSVSLVIAMMELEWITKEDYVRYFAYCSSYRFRFLPVTTELLEAAVFGAGSVKVVDIRKMEHLNLPLLLSEEYGAERTGCEAVITSFVFKILSDQSILDATCEQILLQFISLLPKEHSDRASLRSIEDRCNERAENVIERQGVAINREFIFARLQMLSNVSRIFGYRTE